MTLTPSLHARLDELALIEFTGPDAAAFLHGQLTQDITGLPQGQARLAGYCTAKGRLLATLVVWRSARLPDTFRALVRADVADALAKRLGMFVLRAKVRVQRSTLPIWGVGAGAVATASATPAAPAWTVSETEDGDWIHAPAGGGQADRCWYVAEARPTPPGAETPAWADEWRVQDVRAGLPWVQAATQELFIPQTLNLDLIGGVSFTKGCYPGQEVVARSHYRGTIKRRMAAGRCTVGAGEAPTAPGADIYDARQPDNPWGRVVNLQVLGDDAWLLFEAQLADLGQAELRLGGAQGPAIELLELPYSISAERS